MHKHISHHTTEERENPRMTHAYSKARPVKTQTTHFHNSNPNQEPRDASSLTAAETHSSRDPRLTLTGQRGAVRKEARKIRIFQATYNCHGPTGFTVWPSSPLLNERTQVSIKRKIVFVETMLSAHTRVRVHTHTHTHARAYARTHTHTYTYIHTHTYTHRHTQAPAHTSVVTIQNLIYAQLKTGSKQRLETDEDSSTERKTWL